MRSFYRKWDLVATRSARRVLTLSQFNRDWIKRVYGRDDAVLTYEGVDTKFFRPAYYAPVRAAHPGDNIILHSTDFTKIKGTEYLIRALPIVKRVIPDAKLLVTHTLSNPKRQLDVERLALLLGVSDMVDFIGRVDYQLLPAYYTRASVVVQPSINQSMSLSVKEAMACGIPVITSLEGYEQTNDGDAGLLVDPRDTHALGQALVRILSDKALAKRMGRRGREIVSTRFSWDTVAARFEHEIEGLA
jgi:phosphatidylinositol alpha-1,6-mannosyltransferase